MQGEAYLYCAGCRGEFARFRDAGSGNFKQDYPGLKAVIGAINAGAGSDPLLTSPARTTSGLSVGSGGGFCMLQDGSPARERSSQARRWPLI